MDFTIKSAITELLSYIVARIIHKELVLVLVLVPVLVSVLTLVICRSFSIKKSRIYGGWVGEGLGRGMDIELRGGREGEGG